MKQDYELLAMVVCSVLFLAACVFAIENGNKRRCVKTAEAMEVNYRYDFYAGCLIEVKGKFFPLRNYRSYE